MSRLAGRSTTAVAMIAPAMAVIALFALLPIGQAIVESFYRHDLRLPEVGRPFVGLANYRELFADARFGGALLHTLVFAAVTVALEMILGFVLALGMHRGIGRRGAMRTIALLPWALPTVIVATVWRFLFEGPSSAVNRALEQSGWAPVVWFADAWLAWVPIIAADVWKTTPFVALLLLAGLQQIDEEVRDAARVDGASAWQELWHVTLPLLRPALFVALLFRTLDAFRVFDLIYVMTAGGPGTATEPLALFAHTTLLRHLRFGLGSAASVVIFVISFVLALLYIRVAGPAWRGDER